jgi:hypothetical protein
MGKMIHPSKLSRFTGAEINTLQMRMDNLNENSEILDSIEDYDIWEIVSKKLEEKHQDLVQLMDETYIKSEKRQWKK